MSLKASQRTRPNRRPWWMLGSWLLCMIVLSGGLYGRYHIAEQRLADKVAAEAKLNASEKALAVERAERAEAERALAKAEATYLLERESALFDVRKSALHGYAEVDASGRIQVWNPALTSWLGWTEAEMLGRNITDIMERKDAERHTPAFKAHMADKTNWKLVVQVRCNVKHKDPNHEAVALRITARALPTKDDPNIPYAFALIDLQSRVVSTEARP